MAEQFAPIAKDESFNTTDLTPKNIADVLKDGLQNIADSVKPTADEIPFDNTGTSLSSNNVEDAIKEVAEKYTTSLQISGSPSATINVPESGNFIAFVYFTSWMSSMIDNGGGLFCIKKHGNNIHITPIKAFSNVTLSSYGTTSNTVTLTFSTNLSAFIEAVAFKL